MTPEEFKKALLKNANEVEMYAKNKFPSIAGNITLRFVDGNFRAQGFQGSTFKKWKKSKGTILIKSGRLRSATTYTTQVGQVTIKNNMPYAKIHNEGFNGTISIKAHTRNQYGKTKIGTGKFTSKGKERTKIMTFKKGETMVKAHTRRINLPQRQFIPTTKSPSSVLNKAINREITKDLIKLMK